MQHQRCTLLHYLQDQAVRLGERAVVQAIAAEQVPAIAVGIAQVYRAGTAMQHRCQCGEKPLRQLGRRCRVMQCIANLRQVVLHPTLLLDFIACLAVAVERTRQLADFGTIGSVAKAHAAIAGQQLPRFPSQLGYRRNDPAPEKHQQSAPHSNQIEHQRRQSDSLQHFGGIGQLNLARRQPCIDIAPRMVDRLHDRRLGDPVFHAVNQCQRGLVIALAGRVESAVLQADQGIGIVLRLFDAFHFVGQNAEFAQALGGNFTRAGDSLFGLEFGQIALIAGGGIGPHRVGQPVAAGRQHFRRTDRLDQLHLRILAQIGVMRSRQGKAEADAG